MKENSLLKYAEQLAVGIEALCKFLERKDNSNTIKNSQIFFKGK